MITSSKTVYSGQIFQVVQIPVGQKTYEIAIRSPGVRLIIQLPNKNIILSQEYRREIDSYDYRLPGGKVFDTILEYNQHKAKNQEILSVATEAAKREAFEEVGITSADFSFIDRSVLGSTIEWDLYYFLVTNPKLSHQNLTGEEDIKVVEVSPIEAKKMSLNGQIQEDRSALKLLKFLSNQL